MEKFLVGGAVRDEIMGIKSNDLDYTVVIDNGEYTGPDPFSYMVGQLKDQGYTVFLETPEFLTVRAQTPDKKETADFVLARKEGTYSDGRRPDRVEVGTLESDLARRDFCFNAIAKDSDGSYIDPFNGVADIERRLIRCVGDPFERLTEDSLRAVRALRFSVTKGFSIDSKTAFAMESQGVIHNLVNQISDERIRDELSKMLRFDTVASLRAMREFPILTNALFAGSVSLDATMKTKGRGR